LLVRPVLFFAHFQRLLENLFLPPPRGDVSRATAQVRKSQHLRAIAEDPFHGEGDETAFEAQTILSDGRAKDVSDR
jgi:hypothetical protein